MARSETKGRPVMRLAYASAAAAVVAVAVLAGFFELHRRDAARHALRSDVLGRLSLLRSELQGIVDADVQLTQGLAAIVERQQGMDQPSFARLAESLMRDRKEVRVVAIAPDLVVSAVHPLAGNEAVLGLDYRGVPIAAAGGAAGARPQADDPVRPGRSGPGRCAASSSAPRSSRREGSGASCRR